MLKYNLKTQSIDCQLDTQAGSEIVLKITHFQHENQHHFGMKRHGKTLKRKDATVSICRNQSKL